MMLKTERLMLRPFREFVPFVNDANGKLLYENTDQKEDIV